MNGAEILCDVLLENGVDVCFANPGTSEMHFVAALDSRPRMRCVLGLAEGVVTGAADGYARMAEKPAATLLHLGPGLANGLANLHNARRANTPIVNVVGDHATYHRAYDAPLASDIESLARPMSHWVGRAESADTIAGAADEACREAVARPGVSTLILPADTAWGTAERAPAVGRQRHEPPHVGEDRIAEAAAALREGAACLLLGGAALRAEPLRRALALAEATGATVLAETAVARMEHGAGRPDIDRLPYPLDQARERLARFRTLILVGTGEPVAFFAYPGKPSHLAPDGCRMIALGSRGENLADAIERLADAAGVARAAVPRGIARRREGVAPAAGALTVAGMAAMVAQALPENAIVCGEMLTSEGGFHAASAGSAPHDYIGLTGGAIGIGIPMAAGAAIACPDRKVVSLQADGSGMYSVQGLWTQARERLDVVTVIYANRAYRVLEGELRNVGVAQAGPSARRMLQLDDPALDWVKLAGGLGVEAVRVEDARRFDDAFRAAVNRSGPFLIEAVI